MADQRKAAVEERGDEQQTDDGAHVPDRGADPGEPTQLVRRYQLGQHGVVERLCRLVRVAGDRKREDNEQEWHTADVVALRPRHAACYRLAVHRHAAVGADPPD